jgi:hypothetical protein
MKLEEALKHLREGKKIRHRLLHNNNYVYFQEDEYLMACKVGFRPEFGGDSKDYKLSVTKMKGDYVHTDMTPSLDQCLDGKGAPPSISIMLLLDEDWEVLNET